MKQQRKATRKKTGSTRRTAKAVAPKRKTAKPRGGKPVCLPAECLIASAAGLRTTLLKHLREAGKVRIDASAVQRIDTASLQVLAAFTRDRRSDGLAVEWLGVPACLAEAAGILDLANTLGFENPGSGASVPA